LCAFQIQRYTVYTNMLEEKVLSESSQSNLNIGAQQAQSAPHHNLNTTSGHAPFHMPAPQHTAVSQQALIGNSGDPSVMGYATSPPAATAAHHRFVANTNASGHLAAGPLYFNNSSSISSNAAMMIPPAAAAAGSPPGLAATSLNGHHSHGYNSHAQQMLHHPGVVNAFGGEVMLTASSKSSGPSSPAHLVQHGPYHQGSVKSPPPPPPHGGSTLSYTSANAAAAVATNNMHHVNFNLTPTSPKNFVFNTVSDGIGNMMTASPSNTTTTTTTLTATPTLNAKKFNTTYLD
jgi:hypothetical protein